MAKSPMRRDEEKLQKAVLEAFKYLYPEGIAFHVPNQRGTMIMRMILKGLGVLAGVPDLGFFCPHGHTRWVEIKLPKGTYTDSQKDLHPRLEAMGHTIHVIRDVDEVQPLALALAWRREDAAIAAALAA